jgi:hypothetical protein
MNITTELVHTNGYTDIYLTSPHECPGCHKLAYILRNQEGRTVGCTDCAPRKKP